MDLLSSAIDSIFAGETRALSFEELYRAAYNLVLQKHGKELYAHVHAKIKQRVETVTNALIAAPPDAFLSQLIQVRIDRMPLGSRLPP